MGRNLLEQKLYISNTRNLYPINMDILHHLKWDGICWKGNDIFLTGGTCRMCFTVLLEKYHYVALLYCGFCQLCNKAKATDEIFLPKRKCSINILRTRT